MAMTRIGFGQVEPNHLSAQRTAQIWAQLPAADDIEVLENGQFVKYDYAKGVCDFTGEGEWMMVWNEIKLYDDFWKETYRDFALQKKNFTPGSTDITHDGWGPFPGQMTPRVIKTNPGDIYTTNALMLGNTDGKTVVEMDTYAVGDVLSPSEASKGFLVKDGDGTIQFQVVKVYTLPDGQDAVKLMRIK